MTELYLELLSLENQGVTFYLNGVPCDSMHIANQLNIHDENMYMRDYIFDDGKLSSVHFDRITENY